MSAVDAGKVVVECRDLDEVIALVRELGDIAHGDDWSAESVRERVREALQTFAHDCGRSR